MLLQLVELDVGLTGLAFESLQTGQLCLEVSDLLNTSFVLLVQSLILRDHALLVLEHLVEVLELLREEDGLISDHGVDLI